MTNYKNNKYFFSFYWIFRKCPNFYGNGVCRKKPNNCKMGSRIIGTLDKYAQLCQLTNNTVIDMNFIFQNLFFNNSMDLTIVPKNWLHNYCPRD